MTWKQVQTNWWVLMNWNGAEALCDVTRLSYGSETVYSGTLCCWYTLINRESCVILFTLIWSILASSLKEGRSIRRYYGLCPVKKSMREVSRADLSLRSLKTFFWSQWRHKNLCHPLLPVEVAQGLKGNPYSRFFCESLKLLKSGTCKILSELCVNLYIFPSL